MTETNSSDDLPQTANARLRSEIKARREQAGLSQARLGALVGYTRQYISLAERADHNLPSRDLVVAIDAALGAAGALISLREAARQEHLRERARLGAGQNLQHVSAPPEGDQDHDIVHAAVPRLRRVLDVIDVPDDGPVRPLNDLQRDVEELNEHRLNARYAPIMREIPSLISELARARDNGDEAHKAKVASLMTLALRAADGVAFKLGYLDLSSRIIELMRSAAAATGDSSVIAVAEYVRTETFFASGDLAAARRVLDQAIGRVTVRSAASAAALGALHMRAAVVASRSRRAGDAFEHLNEARRAAQDVREGVYHGTAFGPSSVRTHQLSVATELVDPAGIEAGARWHPPSDLPAERRSHYYIELGRAQVSLGRHRAAYTAIQMAKSAAPLHTRWHPQVAQVLSTLLRSWHAADPDLVDLAAWAKADRYFAPMGYGQRSP